MMVIHALFIKKRKMKFKQFLKENTIYELPHKSGKSKFKTNIPPEQRSFKNLPRDSKKKAKVRFQDWLGIKGNPSKGYDNRWYGYSHRAIASFGIGDTIKMDMIGNKYQYGKDIEKMYSKIEQEKGYEEADKYIKSITFKPYQIKTDEEAKEHAERFRNDVS
jgi:hypothetical protein